VREVDGGLEYGDPIERATVERIARLVGFDPAQVAKIVIGPDYVGVITLTGGGPLEPRTRTYHRRQIR
jgi:hypothetical protein